MASPENIGQQFNKPTTHFVPIPYEDADGNLGYSKIINQGGRHTVLVNIRGTKVPFYISTGMGGKDTVETGKWYPYFGQGKDGWLNKADERSINTHYGSQHLKAVADWLNTNLGDTRGPDRNLFSTDDGSGVPVARNGGPHTAALNSGLNPTTYDGDHNAFIKNIKDTLYKIHFEPRHPTQNERLGKAVLDERLKQHAEKHPELNLGLQLP